MVSLDRKHIPGELPRKGEHWLVPERGPGWPGQEQGGHYPLPSALDTVSTEPLQGPSIQNDFTGFPVVAQQ